MTYPVYDCARQDFDSDFGPVGHASTALGALRILRRHFDGTGADAPIDVELNDRETRDGFIWAWWPIYRQAA